jgi:hypothetical protein
MWLRGPVACGPSKQYLVPPQALCNVVSGRHSGQGKAHAALDALQKNFVAGGGWDWSFCTTAVRPHCIQNYRIPHSPNSTSSRPGAAGGRGGCQGGGGTKRHPKSCMVAAISCLLFTNVAGPRTSRCMCLCVHHAIISCSRATLTPGCLNPSSNSKDTHAVVCVSVSWTPQGLTQVCHAWTHTSVQLPRPTPICSGLIQPLEVVESLYLRRGGWGCIRKSSPAGLANAPAPTSAPEHLPPSSNRKRCLQCQRSSQSTYHQNCDAFATRLPTVGEPLFGLDSAAAA